MISEINDDTDGSCVTGISGATCCTVCNDYKQMNVSLGRGHVSGV
ncbi:MAG: hypothetical protein SOT67_04010 [Bacteroidaceae bacterium]|nr:hypothetical protein [Prevotellaceae bacterium]MDY2849414.1 hypothetical protein [Bacteroidaceae bacterium]